MSNPDDTTPAEPVRDRMIRKPRGNGEHFYWRCPGGSASAGWVGQRRLGTRFTADEAATLRNIPPADLPHIRVVRLKPKAAPPVEAPTTESEALPILFIMAFSKCGDTIFASARVPPGLDVKVGDRVIVGGHAMTVTEINGTLAQCAGTTLPAPTARVDVS